MVADWATVCTASVWLAVRGTGFCFSFCSKKTFVPCLAHYSSKSVFLTCLTSASNHNESDSPDMLFVLIGKFMGGFIIAADLSYIQQYCLFYPSRDMGHFRVKINLGNGF